MYGAFGELIIEVNRYIADLLWLIMIAIENNREIHVCATPVGDDADLQKLREVQNVLRNVATMIKHGRSEAEMSVLREAAGELIPKSCNPTPLRSFIPKKQDENSIILLRRDLDILFRDSGNLS